MGKGFGENIPDTGGHSLGYKLINMFTARLKGNLTVKNNNGADTIIECDISK